MRNKSLLMVCIAATLAGCQANDESLTDFIRGVENQARRDVAKLQPVEDYVVIGYEPEILRAPFELPKEATIATQPLARQDCWRTKNSCWASSTVFRAVQSSTWIKSRTPVPSLVS